MYNNSSSSKRCIETNLPTQIYILRIILQQMGLCKSMILREHGHLVNDNSENGIKKSDKMEFKSFESEF